MNNTEHLRATMLAAILANGILAPPAPRTTDMQPMLREGWWS